MCWSRKISLKCAICSKADPHAGRFSCHRRRERSGSDHSQRIPSRPIDVLITDYDMPHVRGDAVALAFRAMNPALPIVLISGFTRDGWPTALLASAATVVMDKPFSAQELLSAVYSARRTTPPSGTPVS